MFSIRNKTILFSSDRPGSYVTMFGPDGGKLTYSDAESAFNDVTRSYRWAFELPEGSLREGQRFSFITTNHKSTGVIQKDVKSITTVPFGGQVDYSPEGIPLRLLGVSLSALPLQRLAHESDKSQEDDVPRRAFGVQAVLLAYPEWTPDEVGGQLSAALEEVGLEVSRFVVRPLGDGPQASSSPSETQASWSSAEHAIYINYVVPGAIGRAIVAISPKAPLPEGVPSRYDMQDGKPFRVSALFAGEGCGDNFQLMSIHVGSRALPLPEGGVALSHPAMFAALDDGYVADIGTIITVFVKNISTERRAFAGRLLGQER